MTRLHYQQQGAGETLVLLPGFCENLSIWDAIVPTLGKSCRVITIDLPGFGESSHLAAPTSINQAASHIHQFLRSLNIDQYIIAGHSLGGYISLELIKLYPDAISGIGLIHSTAFADDKEKTQTRKKIIDFVNKRGVEAFITPFVPQLFVDKKSPNIAAMINSAITTPIASLINYTIAMMERQDRINTLEKWEKPIVFVAGKKDALINIDQSRKHLLYITESQYMEITEIGHVGMIEAPNQVIKALSALLLATSK